MNPMIFYIIIAFVLLANIFQYWIKSIVKSNGYKTAFFSGHFSDISNFIELLRKTENKSTKEKYQIILSLWSIIIIGFVCCCVVNFIKS